MNKRIKFKVPWEYFQTRDSVEEIFKGLDLQNFQFDPETLKS